MTLHDQMRARLLSRAGLTPHDPSSVGNTSVSEVRKTEWSKDFERLMRSRLVMGALRYGFMHDPDRPAFQYVEYAIKRLNLFLETGDAEMLVDAANLCLLEFVTGDIATNRFGLIGENNEKVKPR